MERTTMFVCRRGVERSPRASLDHEGARYLPGGWETLLEEIGSLSEHEKVQHIRSIFANTSPIFIFDHYEQTDQKVKSDFMNFKHALASAGYNEGKDFMVKTSQQIMQEMFDEAMKRRGM